MRKTLFVLIILIAAVGVTFATSGNEPQGGSEDNINPAGVFPIAKETMELNIFMSIPDKVIDIDTNEAVLYIEDYTNIDLNIDAGASDSREKVSLMLAAQQDLPDLFVTYGAISREQLAVYGEQGVFEPLNPYLEDGWLPNLEAVFEYQPLVEPQLTMPDGNIYSFTRYGECMHCLHSQKMWLNMTWIDNLGLEVPATPDEFYEMLIAFRDNDANGNGDPDDEVPLLGMMGKGWRTDIPGYLMNPFAPATIRQDIYLYNDNGTLKSGMHQSGWKEGMIWLAKLYDEGLLDEESFVMDPNMAKALTGANSGNRVGSIQAGAFGPFVNTGVPGARDEFLPLAPLVGPGGTQRTPYFRPATDPRGVVTTAAAEDKKLAAMRLLDLFMVNPFSGVGTDLEVGLSMQYGPNGWETPAGKLGLNGEPALYEWTFNFNEPTNINFANLIVMFAPIESKAVMAAREAGEFDAEKILWDATETLYEPYSTDMWVPPVVIPGDMASEIGEIKQILTDYMDEGIANFIIGERDVATEWDDFLGELESLGFTTYLTAMQDAYDSQYK